MSNNRDEDLFAEDEGSPQLNETSEFDSRGISVQSARSPSESKPMQVSGKRKRSWQEDPEEDCPDHILRAKVPRLSASHLDHSVPLYFASDFRRSDGVTPGLTRSPSYDPYEWAARILASSEDAVRVESRLVLQITRLELKE